MFGVGAIFGPFLAALLMTEVGHTGVFLFTGGVHLGLAAFVTLRMWQHRPVHPSKKAAAFLAMPETTHAVLPLDPRSEGRGAAMKP
jgi:dipeptide/tripeptide permease